MIARAAAIVAIMAATATDAPRTYLGASALALADIIPPPPTAKSSEQASDRASYARAASAIGSAAWDRAIGDRAEAPAGIVARMRCATHRDLNPTTTPRTLALLTAAERDLSGPLQLLKQRYKRPRPYAGDFAGKLCEPVSADQRLQTSPSYPSGHAAEAALAGYVLASLLPDQSAGILTRARQYGDSRVVCRVHFPTDVRAGQALAAGLFARLEAEPRFRSDADLARAELAGIAPDRLPPACQ